MGGGILDPPVTEVPLLIVIITLVRSLKVMAIIDFEMADRETATGVVGLVQAYVNTVDVQDGPEQLSDPNTLTAWLVAHELMETAHTPTAAPLKHAIPQPPPLRT